MNVLLDETGLHDPECPCMRCEAGYRPTSAERWRAREALRLRREREAESPETKKAREHREANQRREREIRERQRLDAEERAKFRPLTPEQIEELRREFPHHYKRRSEP